MPLATNLQWDYAYFSTSFYVGSNVHGPKSRHSAVTNMPCTNAGESGDLFEKILEGVNSPFFHTEAPVRGCRGRERRRETKMEVSKVEMVVTCGCRRQERWQHPVIVGSDRVEGDGMILKI